MKRSLSVLINSADVGKYTAQIVKANMSCFQEKTAIFKQYWANSILQILLSLIVSCLLTLGAIPEMCNHKILLFFHGCEKNTWETVYKI